MSTVKSTIEARYPFGPEERPLAVAFGGGGLPHVHVDLRSFTGAESQSHVPALNDASPSTSNSEGSPSAICSPAHNTSTAALSRATSSAALGSSFPYFNESLRSHASVGGSLVNDFSPLIHARGPLLAGVGLAVQACALPCGGQLSSPSREAPVQLAVDSGANIHHLKIDAGLRLL